MPFDDVPRLAERSGAAPRHRHACGPGKHHRIRGGGRLGQCSVGLGGVFGADLVKRFGPKVLGGFQEAAGWLSRGFKRAEPGAWVPVKESMSRAAREYQELAGGTPGRVHLAGSEAYVVDGVRFDGWLPTAGALVDTKGPSYTRLLKYGFGDSALKHKHCVKAGLPRQPACQ